MGNKRSVYFNRNALQFVGIDEVVKKRLQATYPNVNIDLELTRMSLWLISEKGKSHVGTMSFITKWLSKAKPEPESFQQNDFLEKEPLLRPLFLSYLEDLWTGREHILEFNTIY